MTSTASSCHACFHLDPHFQFPERRKDRAYLHVCRSFLFFFFFETRHPLFLLASSPTPCSLSLFIFRCLLWLERERERERERELCLFLLICELIIGLWRCFYQSFCRLLRVISLWFVFQVAARGPTTLHTNCPIFRRLSRHPKTLKKSIFSTKFN